MRLPGFRVLGGYLGRRALLWISPLAVLLLWVAVCRAGVFPEQILVSPGVVLDTFVELWASGELPEHIGLSLYRLAWGFALGVFLGVAFGVSMALSPLVEKLFSPFFNAVRQVPSIAFIPVFILMFGVEETFKIVIVTKAAFFPVAVAAVDAVKGIPQRLVEVAKVYRLPLLPLVRRLILPSTVPPIFTGMRLSLTRAWIVLVAAELLASDSGIGQMMEMGRQMFRIDIVMVGVALTGVIGFTLDRGCQLMEWRLIRWRTR
ncbi:MAG: ABC transporter permease [Zoogloeaceae bacterium]|jgi:sulfonate transport system permease protein|nr:ABC transporter permease [Zoogloeaceae bacterium]